MLDESRGSDAVTCACTCTCTRACTCTCTCTCTNAHSRANTDTHSRADTDTKPYAVFVCSDDNERCHLMWQPDANGGRNC